MPESKAMTRTSSSSTEKPLCRRPRRLADWLNPDGQRKVHSLVDKVYQPKNLRVAWEKVKANRGSGGIDGQGLEEFEQGLDEHLGPSPQLLNRQEPIFEPDFDDSSFGYRLGRSAKDALRKVWREIEAGAEWIVDADLRDYFGSVQHDKLLALLQ